MKIKGAIRPFITAIKSLSPAKSASLMHRKIFLAQTIGCAEEHNAAVELVNTKLVF